MKNPEIYLHAAKIYPDAIFFNDVFTVNKKILKYISCDPHLFSSLLDLMEKKPLPLMIYQNKSKRIENSNLLLFNDNLN